MVKYVEYIHTDPLANLTNYYIDTGIFPTTATKMRFVYIGKGMMAAAKFLGFSQGSEEDVYKGATDSTDYRYFGANGHIYWDYNNSRLENGNFNNYSDGVLYDVEIGNNYVKNNLDETMIVNGTTQTNPPTPNIPIMVNVSVIWFKSLQIWEGQTLVFDGQAALDPNDVPCIYDRVNQTYVYHQGTGITLTAGPILSTIKISPSEENIPSSGGTVEITVESETDWTATTTGNFFTMSATAGTPSDTAITITVPSTTSTTQQEATILFENAVGDTAEFTLKQRKYSAGGIHLMNIGEAEIDTLYIGDQPIEYIYLGNEIVYQAGEFVGLKMKQSTTLQMTNASYSLKIQSSEPWTLAKPSTADWLTFSETTGTTGVSRVTLTATDNGTGADRSTTITATTANYSATCEVTQIAVNYVSYIHSDPLVNDTTTGIDTGIIPTVNTSFRVQGIFKPLDSFGSGLNIVGNLNPSYIVFMLRNWIGRGNSNLFDIGSTRLESNPQGYIYDSSPFDVTYGNFFINYNDADYQSATGTTQSFVYDKTIMIYSGWWFKSLQIWEGQTLVFDGQAALDPNDVPCVYDSVSNTYKYSNAQSMAYEE